jgi:ribosome-binding ATPase
MNIGIIGPTRSGKTTVFHLLTGTAPDPHADLKHEVRHAVTSVPDPRVDKLGEISQSKKLTFTTVEYVDMPPFDAGASKSDWFAHAMDSGIKTSDALLLIVRGFGAEEAGKPLDPLRDMLMVQEELMLADLILLEKKQERLLKQRRVKTPTSDEKAEIEILERALAHLNGNQPLRTLKLDPLEKKMLRGFQFLSEKPLLAVINAEENSLTAVIASIQDIHSKLSSFSIETMALSAKLEEEIAELPPDEQAAFMADIGVAELARDRVLHSSQALLGLQAFLTTGEKESRAWPMIKGGTAVEAAGVIHTDLARGFIRAEVVHFDDFVREGGYPGCKHKGLLRLEGKEYPVKDGDILLIRHSG